MPITKEFALYVADGPAVALAHPVGGSGTHLLFRLTNHGPAPVLRTSHVYQL